MHGDTKPTYAFSVFLNPHSADLSARLVISTHLAGLATTPCQEHSVQSTGLVRAQGDCGEDRPAQQLAGRRHVLLCKRLTDPEKMGADARH